MVKFLHICKSFSFLFYTVLCLFFRSPRDPKVHHVKRVTATPGEIIDVRNRPPMPLGPLEYWMLSDNAIVGEDSRYYGPVNIGLFQGKVVFILWPLSRFGSID